MIPQQLLQILSKIVSLHIKLTMKCIQTSRKEKFHKQPVVILFKNDCCVRHMFFAIFFSLSAAKILRLRSKCRGKSRGKSTTPATSKQELFVALANAVNYCHKEIYYRCCRDPRYTTETSYYKKFKKEQLQDNVKSNKNLTKQFFWVESIVREAIFLGGIFPRGNFPGRIFLGGIFLGVNFPGDSILGGFFSGTFFPGGIFPDTQKK